MCRKDYFDRMKPRDKMTDIGKRGFKAGYTTLPIATLLRVASATRHRPAGRGAIEKGSYLQ